MTRLGPKRIHQVRVRGGNIKHRALRLESGNFAWGSEHVTRKTRIIGVVYNASNNELVRTNTLVKGSIIQVDAAPFRQWYEAHYHQPVSKKGKVRWIDPSTKPTRGNAEFYPLQSTLTEEKGTPSEGKQKKLDALKAQSKIDPLLETQFQAGRLYANIASRPGQSGRADGYILEGKELEFYVRRCASLFAVMAAFCRTLGKVQRRADFGFLPSHSESCQGQARFLICLIRWRMHHHHVVPLYRWCYRRDKEDAVRTEPCRYSPFLLACAWLFGVLLLLLVSHVFAIGLFETLACRIASEPKWRLAYLQTLVYKVGIDVKSRHYGCLRYAISAALGLGITGSIFNVGVHERRGCNIRKG